MSKHPDMTIVSTEKHDFAGRRRRVVNVAGEGTDAESLLDIARQHARLARAHVLVVFAWRDPSEVGKLPFTAGRLQLSRDGKGWDGEGNWLVGTDAQHKRDTGVPVVDLVTEWAGALPVKRETYYLMEAKR